MGVKTQIRVPNADPEKTQSFHLSYNKNISCKLQASSTTSKMQLTNRNELLYIELKIIC